MLSGIELGATVDGATMLARQASIKAFCRLHLCLPPACWDYKHALWHLEISLLKHFLGYGTGGQ